MQKSSVLVLASIGVALLALELMVRGYYTAGGHLPPHPDPSVRAEWSWAKAHLSAARATLPGSAEFDSSFGWLPDRDLTRWLAAKTVGMTRRTLTEARHTVEGEVHPRLLFLGDSFTFGTHVDNAATFPAVLQRTHLPNWEVLNLGVPGFGPDQMLLLYEQLGTRFSPDVVVFGLYTAGVERATRRFEHYAKPYFVLAGERLVLHGIPVVPPELLYDIYQRGHRGIAPFPYSYLYGAVAASLVRLADSRAIDDADPRWKLVEAILTQFHRDTTEHGTRPFLLVIPSDDDVASGEDAPVDALAITKAHALGMDALSLRKPFAEEETTHPESPLFRPRTEGGHFSAQGHAVTARLLQQALRRSGAT